MIKEVSRKVLKKINPNTTQEEEKWINVFNEVQYRTDVLFEAIVSFYSLELYLSHLEHQGLGNDYELYPTRYKTSIYRSYINVELNNILDPKGQSSIVAFINFFDKDLDEKTPKVKSIFKSNVKIEKLNNHFKLFNKWLQDHNEEIAHIKYMRDKNFSHVDHNFKYNNEMSCESLISMIVFISDYLSKLTNILDFSKVRVIKGEPVAINRTLMDETPKEIIEIRFKQEIGYLVNNLNFSKKAKKTFLLNCYESIAETLKEVNLIKI